jgi:S-DNA-T family DNA segregation ATPase FtsK/SpoIIIE
MATNSSAKKQTTAKSNHFFKDILGLFFLFLFFFTIISLWSYHSQDPSFFTVSSRKAKNLAGTFGSHWSSILWQVFGAASYMLALTFLLVAVGMFRRISRSAWGLAAVNFSLLLISTAASLGLVQRSLSVGGSQFLMGGIIGEALGGILQSYLNTWGASLVSLFLFVFALSLSFKLSVRDLLLYAWWGSSKVAVLLAGFVLYVSMQIWSLFSQAYGELRPKLSATLASAAEQLFELFKRAPKTEREEDAKELPEEQEPEIVVPAPRAEPAPNNVVPLKLVTSAPEIIETKHAANSEEPTIILNEKAESDLFDAPGEMAATAGEKAKFSPLLNFVKSKVKENEKSLKTALGKKINYELPPLTFLNTPITEESKLDRDELIRNSKMLEEKLADFNVKGQVTAVKPGPVVTMYEFKPAAGVKVSAISNLSDDLTLALSAKSIRIVAPIPGRDVVGIEVPNRHRESVLLKEIIGAETFHSKNHSIPIAIGKDILGSSVVADLAKMPHLLVAGTTGSGKSVFINSLICSLLYKFSPEQMNLILVDPKQLELAPYNDIPHLLLPVVTEPKKASLALNWAVQEMERRYRVIAASVTRDQEGYNKKFNEIGAEKMEALLNRGKEDFAEKLSAERMPKLVVIIDELADLMMTAKSDVENNICRLAQKARAAGIHLVLATQRPSTDVITGLIKANLPSRICFKVSSKVDSRVMFDAMGAEKLIGMGDMLFMPPGDSSLVRMHGAYLSVEEVDQITNFWKAQGKPNYREDILIDPEEEDGFGLFSEEDTKDPVYQQALEIAYSSGAISASYLQRRLRIGYNKAARYVEMMEAQGVVGPADGAKPRPVLSPRP